MGSVDRSTETVRKRYDRIAPCYDFLVSGLPSSWWRLLWHKVEGDKILEVGVGTGKSFPFYPPGVKITAIDFSGRMLDRARAKVEKHALNVRLLEMDVENLELKDDTFDSVVGSLVFCSVPHPMRGLMEVKRVCKQGGKVVLLEHVLSKNHVAAWLMNFLNPVALSLVGDNINRDTVHDVVNAGLTVGRVLDLKAGIFKLIEAKKG